MKTLNQSVPNFRSQSKAAPQGSSSNPYGLPKGYVANPLDHLYDYQGDEIPISDAPEIQGIFRKAKRLSEMISGDFNLKKITNRFKRLTLFYVEQGLILSRIKFFKLYEPEYDNFGDFCKNGLEWSRNYADRIIRASDVALALIVNGFRIIPRNESQCRLLSSYIGSELVHCWREFLKVIEEPHKITAAAIAKFLADKEEPYQPEDTWIRIPKHLSNPLERLALRCGKSLQFVVTAMLEHQVEPIIPCDNWHDIVAEMERVENWEDDLDKIVKEKEERDKQREEILKKKKENSDSS